LFILSVDPPPSRNKTFISQGKQKPKLTSIIHFYRQTGIPIMFSQPQGPSNSSPAKTLEQNPYPATQPGSRTHLSSEIRNNTSKVSPPSVIKVSPTMNSQGTSSRPGGIAYDHRDLPKIIAVHSLPSSPVYVREQLKEATLLPDVSKVPFLSNESIGKDMSSRAIDSRTRPSNKV
jgi:hypothetical protein